MQADNSSSKSALPGEALLSRRGFLAAGGAATAAAVISSCGSGSASGGEGPELAIWASTAFASDASAPLAKAGEKYAERFGGSVSVQGIPANDLVHKITTTVAGGGGPDIAIIDATAVPQLAAAQSLVDITKKFSSIKSDFFAGNVSAGQYKGKQFAVPFDTSNVALFWNKKMFSAAGISEPPADWDALLSAATELTGNGKYGYMLGAHGYGAFLFWPWLWQNGGAITNADATKATFNSAAGVEAWKFYSGLYLEHKVVPPTFLTVSQSWDQYIAPFVQERVAMMAIGDWGIKPLEKGNPNLDYGVAPLPKGKETATILGGNAIVISSNSKHKDAAWDFVKWLTSAKQENVLESYKRIPARKDIVGSKFAEKTAARKTFVEQAEAARSRPAAPNWGDIEWVIMADSWDSVIHKKAEPESALNDAARKATAKLSG